MEILRPWPKWTLFTRPSRLNCSPGNCMVPVARMGLHFKKGHDDDSAPHASATNFRSSDYHMNSNKKISSQRKEFLIDN